MRGEDMTQTRLDLPWNFPTDWEVPDFMDGEIPILVMEEGARIIGTQKALVMAEINKAPDLRMLKTGIACYRLGWLFEENRAVILEALKREKALRGGEGRV